VRFNQLFWKEQLFGKRVDLEFGRLTGPFDFMPFNCRLVEHKITFLSDAAEIPMTHSYRDDSPEEFSLCRRKILIGGGVLLGGLAAVTSVSSIATDASETTFLKQFMELSSLLIPHQLDRGVGVRLATALRMQDPAFTARVESLLDIAKRKQATIVEDFFSDVPDGPLRDAALVIVSAWYLGVIVDAPGAEVFAYELALMYQPTIDVMTIPTYAISGPNGWTSEAPPLSDMPKF
jgi:fructose 5-dehydrogenase small subunit